MSVAPAAPGDLAAVEALLADAGLPLAGVRDQFPAGFVVARGQDGIVGACGLEVHGEAGLLRSAVVRPSARRHGLGARLVEAALSLAPATISQVFLLTTTARDFFLSRPFAGWRFAPTSRAAAPPRLAQSVEFASACPATAACLVAARPLTR